MPVMVERVQDLYNDQRLLEKAVPYSYLNVHLEPSILNKETGDRNSARRTVTLVFSDNSSKEIAKIERVVMAGTRPTTAKIAFSIPSGAKQITVMVESTIVTEINLREQELPSHLYTMKL